MRLPLPSGLRTEPPSVGRACRRWGEFEMQCLRTTAVLPHSAVAQGTPKSLWTRGSLSRRRTLGRPCARAPSPPQPRAVGLFRPGGVRSPTLWAVLSPRPFLRVPWGPPNPWSLTSAGPGPGVGGGGLSPVSFPRQLAATPLRTGPLGGPQGTTEGGRRLPGVPLCAHTGDRLICRLSPSEDISVA